MSVTEMPYFLIVDGSICPFSDRREAVTKSTNVSSAPSTRNAKPERSAKRPMTKALDASAPNLRSWLDNMDRGIEEMHRDENIRKSVAKRLS